MARTCTICAHPERKSIDARIANKEPYLRIAKRFGLNDVTVRSHAQKHVLPVIEDIEIQANAAVLERVMSYRDEVNLPLPEKSKAIEDKLWAEFEAADPKDRMPIVREINKQQIEQAKLSGAYVNPATNPADLDIVNSVIAKLKSSGYDDEKIAAFTKANFPELATEVVS